MTGVLSLRVVSGPVDPPRWRRIADAAFYPLLAGYAAYALAWLLLGLALGVAADVPALHHLVDQWQGRLAHGVEVGMQHSEVGAQAILDYLFSAINIGLGVVLLRSAPRDWTVRLLVIGMIGSAGAFNLQAHADTYAIEAAFGVNIGWPHTALLHGVGGVCYVFALLMFPTGRLGFTQQARWMARAVIGAVVAATIGLLSVSTASYPHPISFIVFFGLATPVVGVTAQLRRYAGATDAESRQQSRVLLWALGLAFGAAALLSLATIGLAALQPSSLAAGADMPGMAGMTMQGSDTVVFWTCRAVFTVIPCALLVGILRFRLWDVEQLLNRTFVYGVLAVVIGGLYLGVVVVADWLLRLPGRSNLPVQLLAAAAVVLALRPVRSWVSALANRLVYGHRPAPYDVLARMSALAEATVAGSTVLPLVARVAAEGLAVDRCEIRLSGHDGSVTRYRWPAGADERGYDHVTEIRHNGERVGELAIDRASAARLSADQRRLLVDLAGGCGLVLRTAQLTIELEHRLATIAARAEEISASRRRIISEQDAERRNLERNLHDGAQPQLVALRMTLGLLAYQTEQGNTVAATALIDQLDAGLADADRSLAELAQGLYPPRLREHGLVAALREQAEKLGARVELGAGPDDGVDDGADDGFDEAGLSEDITVAVCLACAEALNNAAKHAPGAEIRIQLDRDERELRFAVTDNGPGFRTDQRPGGLGLLSMSDRLAAVAGWLRIESVVGQGTRVSGQVPLPSPTRT